MLHFTSLIRTIKESSWSGEVVIPFTCPHLLECIAKTLFYRILEHPTNNQTTTINKIRPHHIQAGVVNQAPPEVYQLQRLHIKKTRVHIILCLLQSQVPSLQLLSITRLLSIPILISHIWSVEPLPFSNPPYNSPLLPSVSPTSFSVRTLPYNTTHTCIIFVLI